MACLRQEIAAKIGPAAISGDSSTSPQLGKISIEGKQVTDDISRTNDQDKDRKISWITKTMNFISDYKITLAVFFIAFIFGGIVGRLRSTEKSRHILSSYDLELEVLREFNVTKVSLNPLPRGWSSVKFKRTHSKLAKLHDDFATVRQSIWYTLQKIKDLERRVYKAEMAALLGDKLLACYGQRDNPACSILHEQWKTLLRDQ